MLMITSLPWPMSADEGTVSMAHRLPSGELEIELKRGYARACQRPTVPPEDYRPIAL